MKVRERIVIDTNAFVGRLLVPRSVPAQAVQKALESADLLVSEATMNELADVLSRSRFDSYVTMEERRHFFRLLSQVVEMVSIVSRVRACRDPEDDKILEVAVNGSASMIVTGDKDLLAMRNFQRISIITAASYLSRS